MKLEVNQIVDVVVKTERGGTFVATRKGKVLALLADRVKVAFADGEVKKVAYSRVRPAR